MIRYSIYIDFKNIILWVETPKRYKVILKCKYSLQNIAIVIKLKNKLEKTGAFNYDNI